MASTLQKSPRPSLVRSGKWLSHLLLLMLALGLEGSLGAENNTVRGAEMLPETSNEHREELKLDQELRRAYDLAARTLESYKDHKSKLLIRSNEIIEGQTSKDGIASKLDKIEKMKDDVYAKIDGVDKRIREINALQITELKEKVELLYERELGRRALMEEKEKMLKERQENLNLKKKKRKLKKKILGSKKKKLVIPEGAIPKEKLQELVDVKALLGDSDEKIESLYLGIVEQEVDVLQGELENVVIESTKGLQTVEDEEKEKIEASAESQTDDCSGASLTSAVQLVQESLVKFSHDKVGMIDHLTKAHVVHHLTSENFVPPSYSYQALDDMWWFQYLPDDWEKGLDSIMPEDWRKWNVAIPDYVFHTFGLQGRAATAPPEAILKPSLHPGSCWPMAGQSGQVTLRLPYPVQVTALTLDHAPSLLFEDQTKRQSAPKNVRVFGFPPCWTKKVDGKQSPYLDNYLDEDDEDAEYYRGICEDGLDFDLSKPVVLHDLLYDLEGPSIQTFHMPLPEEDEDDEVEEGSCSQAAGTCGGGLDGPNSDYMYSSSDRSDSITEGVSAIRLEVTDNWGNEDYTCIYRFRVHGDAIDPNDA